MSEHEAWGSRMQRGTFDPEDWARDLKRDIALWQEADAAVRKEVEENEGDDPMSDEYKSLDFARIVAASNTHRHLNHDVLIAIADFVMASKTECFKLAAGVCEHRSGDDHGNPYCLKFKTNI